MQDYTSGFIPFCDSAFDADGAESIRPRARLIPPCIRCPSRLTKKLFKSSCVCSRGQNHRVIPHTIPHVWDEKWGAIDPDVPMKQMEWLYNEPCSLRVVGLIIRFVAFPPPLLVYFDPYKELGIHLLVLAEGRDRPTSAELKNHVLASARRHKSKLKPFDIVQQVFARQTPLELQVQAHFDAVHVMLPFAIAAGPGNVFDWQLSITSTRHTQGGVVLEHAVAGSAQRPQFPHSLDAVRFLGVVFSVPSGLSGSSLEDQSRGHSQVILRT